MNTRGSAESSEERTQIAIRILPSLSIRSTQSRKVQVCQEGCGGSVPPGTDSCGVVQKVRSRPTFRSISTSMTQVVAATYAGTVQHKIRHQARECDKNRGRQR